jgi:hypothetical protein
MEKIASVFVVIAAVSFIYKIYVHSKIKTYIGKSEPSFFMPKISNVLYFLPLSKKNRSTQENVLVRRANWALLIFYLCLVIISIIAIIFFRVNNIPINRE